MEVTLLRTMVQTFWLMVTIDALQGVVFATSLQTQRVTIDERLELLNKSPVKTFQTIYGDILDCVEINKQPAFDHPLLKNHEIQKKPNLEIYKQTTLSDNSKWKAFEVVPKGMRCPTGTIPIKRILKEDLAMQKLSSLLGTSSRVGSLDDVLPAGHQVATLVAAVNNTGVAGLINLWSPVVSGTQLSDAGVFVGSDDGSVSNVIAAGWAVNPYWSPNYSRLFAYWSKDSGKSTGCFNVLCPGFVQVSKTTYLGAGLHPVSTYGGDQFFVNTTIAQDLATKNWWLLYGTDAIGYWPKELFSTLTNGATRAGWGGEIASSPGEPTPAMGSGFLPQAGFKRASIISFLRLFGMEIFPSGTDLKLVQSAPNCYQSAYDGDGGPNFGQNMYFGGPPNCKL